MKSHQLGFSSLGSAASEVCTRYWSICGTDWTEWNPLCIYTWHCDILAFILCIKHIDVPLLLDNIDFEHWKLTLINILIHMISV
jgi:hypothetical protein